MGIADDVYVFVHSSMKGAVGPALRVTGWFTLVWTWMAICAAVGLLVSWPRLGRLRGVALAFAGPGIFLLSRVSTPVKDALQVSPTRVFVYWLAATLLLAIPFAFIPFTRPRRYWPYVAALLLSTGVLTYRAAEVSAVDWFPFTNRAIAQATGRNVVLIFLDTATYDDMLGGAAPAMPRFARFTQRALSFTSAWAPAPWTIPSHRAVLTGVSPWSLKGATAPELAEQFRSRGYHTAAIFANPLLSPSYGFGKGFDELYVSGRSGPCASAFGDLLNRLPLHGGPRVSLCGWFAASEVTRRAERFISRADRPYFLALNFIDAHNPYFVQTECRSHDFVEVPREEREAVVNARPENGPPKAAFVQRVRAQYRTAAECMDRSLGAFLENLTRDPNTVVAIVGDHGEQFGEHGLGEHGNSVYRQVLHVPLVLHVPGHAPQEIADPVSIVDLYRTLPRAADPERAGTSLPILESLHRQPVLSHYALDFHDGEPVKQAFSVTVGDFQYIRHGDGAEELFDYRTDPAETSSIPPDAMPAIAAPMRAAATRAAQEQERVEAFNALGYMQ